MMGNSGDNDGIDYRKCRWKRRRARLEVAGLGAIVGKKWKADEDGDDVEERESKRIGRYWMMQLVWER